MHTNLTRDDRRALLNLRRYGRLDDGASGMYGRGPALVELGLVRLESHAISSLGIYYTHQYLLTSEGAEVARDLENEVANADW
jgi:hypothetical protein